MQPTASRFPLRVPSRSRETDSRMESEQIVWDVGRRTNYFFRGSAIITRVGAFVVKLNLGLHGFEFNDSNLMSFMKRFASLRNA